MGKSRKRRKILKCIYFQPEYAEKLDDKAKLLGVGVSDLVVSVMEPYLDETQVFKIKISPQDAVDVINKSRKKFVEEDE